MVLRDRNREIFSPFFDGVFNAIGVADSVGRNREFSHELTTFLASGRVNDLTDDDKTLVVALRKAR